MTMRVVFISLPMSGYTDEIIKANIEHAKRAYLAITGFEASQVVFVNNMDAANLAHEEMSEKQLRIWYLGHAISKLAACDEAFFWGDWKHARGCVIEHEVCSMYDIPRISVEKNGFSRNS